MALIIKHIQNPPDSPCLDQIKSGHKEYEGRLFTKIDEWKLKIGTRIKFQESETSWVLIEVTDLLKFNDFGEAYEQLGDKLIPNSNKQEVIALYNGLFHYYCENVARLNQKSKPSKMIRDNGVVTIKMKILSMR